MSEPAVNPTIPGVVLGEMLGQGGMSCVYSGTRINDQTTVAVKILQDTHDRTAARFLEGARLQQSLQHPNISKVLDFGESDAGCYTICEYLPGGDLNTRLRRGMQLQALIKVIKDIARALDYAHAVGIIHRDIKPENILFKANGNAVLTDFDIAASISQDSSKSDTGTVIGTPEYMSPEQAAGRTLDGRTDLYSLGVITYRILTGDLPYKADTAVSTGIKHLQEPVPKMPNYLRAFQEFIDKALAKRPEHRFQNGEEMVRALDAIRAAPTLPEATFKTQPISTQEIVAVGGDLLTTTRDSARQERQSKRNQRKRRVRTVLTSLLLVVVAFGASYYVLTSGLVEPKRILAQLGIGEDPLLTVAWSEAQSLRQDPNQSLAAIVAGYRRVLTLEPDHVEAQIEVDNLNADWKLSINEAFGQGNLEAAETRLAEGKNVFPNDSEWVQFEVELQNRQRAERILQSTQALLTSNGIDDLPSATAAIQSFQEVLRLWPERAEAQVMLNEIAVHYASAAGTAANNGEVAQAINLLERATAADATLTELDDVRKLISQATTAQAAIDDLLQQARSYRADNQLIKPAGENAAELYHRVLATDPDNVFAAQGLNEVTAQITATAEQLLADDDLAGVALLVNQASAAGMSEEVVNEIRSKLDLEQSRLDSIAANLALAQERITQGYLTAPTDDNAVKYLRDVQQVDPGNPQAATLLTQCAERLADVAQEAYEFGLTDAAEQYLDLALTITPEVAEWVQLRDRWEGAKTAAENAPQEATDG